MLKKSKYFAFEFEQYAVYFYRALLFNEINKV